MENKKNFLCRFNVLMGETGMKHYYIDQGTSKDDVIERNEVEHDECGLDTENSPIGGACGQYCTELYDVYEITPDQKKFLNSIGIH